MRQPTPTTCALPGAPPCYLGSLIELSNESEKLATPILRVLGEVVGDLFLDIFAPPAPARVESPPRVPDHAKRKCPPRQWEVQWKKKEKMSCFCAFWLGGLLPSPWSAPLAPRSPPFSLTASGISVVLFPCPLVPGKPPPRPLLFPRPPHYEF